MVTPPGLSWRWRWLCLLAAALSVSISLAEAEAGSEEAHRCYLSRVQPAQFLRMRHDQCTGADHRSMSIEHGVYPGVEIPLQREDLECMTSHDEYRSCASCFLCQYHLHHSHDIFAYKYAIQSLEASPRSPPALSCLAALYMKKQAFVRAAFYAAASYEADPSLNIPYTVLRGTGCTSIYQYLSTTHATILRPQYQHVLVLLSFLNPDDAHAHTPAVDTATLSIMTDIFEAVDGSITLYAAYQQHLHHLPMRMVGPGVLAFEEFLNLVENLLHLYAVGIRELTPEENDPSLIAELGINFGTELFAAQVLQETLPSPVNRARWPQDKTVNLLVQPHYASTTAIFAENIRGMADSLARLGVPFRVITRLIPENDFVSLQNYGLMNFYEVMDKNFVFWNFEKLAHPEEKANANIDNSNNTVVFASEYVQKCTVIWETIFSNVFRYDSRMLAKVKYVASPLPETVILTARAMQHFAEKIKTTVSPESFYTLMDAYRPIDILFFGNVNPHRSEIHTEFRKLAKQHNLRIEFHMSYGLFGSHLNLLISQAKVVLNLANLAWPCAGAGGEGQECVVNAMNLHRVRSLLARGKTVLSESTGSIVEEEMHTGIVQFAPSAELTSAALHLLRTPQRRWELERNAIRFMTADIFDTQVPLFEEVFSSSSSSSSFEESYNGSHDSSLVQISNALLATAERLWPGSTQAHEGEGNEAGEVLAKYSQVPEDGAGAGGDDGVDRERYLRARATSRYVSAHRMKEELVALLTRPGVRVTTKQPSFDASRAAEAAYALAWTEIRCLHSSTWRQDLLYTSEINENAFGVVGSRDGHSRCDQRVTLEIIVGYLARRYRYGGNVLLIGCDPGIALKLTRAFKTLAFEIDDGLSLRLQCLNPSDSTASFSDQISSFGILFDVVVINQALLKMTFVDLRECFGAAMDSLSQAGEGEGGGGGRAGGRRSSVLINGMLPDQSPHSEVEADPYQLLLHMRSYGTCDAALGLFEEGLLLVIPRQNPYTFALEVLKKAHIRYFDYRKQMDRFIPVLSLAEMHIWLSSALGTKRYVRSTDEVTAEEYEERRRFFRAYFNISIDDMRAPD